MSYHERSIKFAVDRITGEILEADQIFHDKIDAFSIRRQYHENDVELHCIECDQELNVSTSKYDRLHFKHQPRANECILNNGDLSPKQREEFQQVHQLKESQRHKDLKALIAEKISKVNGVDTDSIAVDNKFIIKGNEKRRPDVQCKYKGKHLVFEIQLSQLSLSYILNRHNFYLKHGIYLIWVLDNFDIHKQSQLERDIKYLAEHQNFFKLDEKAEDFKLRCRYKETYLLPNNKIYSKWMHKSVSLDEVLFDEQVYQIYYYNFGNNKRYLQNQQKLNFLAIQEEKRKKKEAEDLEEAKRKGGLILEQMALLKKDKVLSISVKNMINDLDQYQLKILNERLDFKNKIEENGTPFLHDRIRSAEKKQKSFIAFLLECIRIKLDVNKRDANGCTLFEEIYRNSNLNTDYLIKLLFKRGYQFSSEDEIYLNSLADPNGEMKLSILIYKSCNLITDKTQIDRLFEYKKLFFTLESAKAKQIIGFDYKPGQWIRLVNNAIEYYGPYWEYVERAFKYYGLWDSLIKEDKKGTFQKKLQKFYSNTIEKRWDFDTIFRDLYPELI